LLRQQHGYSHERIRQLQALALGRLREVIERSSFGDVLSRA
jgi:DNA-directed RNA polymerase sigma subunit (sigma70/sigma32)